MAPRKPSDESGFFPENKLPPPTPEQAVKISDLNKIKDKMAKSSLDFQSLFKDQTLFSNQTQEYKDKQKTNLNDLINSSMALEKYTPSEGIHALLYLSLHSLFKIHDDLNDLKFQNVFLHKKIKMLENEAKEKL